MVETTSQLPTPEPPRRRVILLATSLVVALAVAASLIGWLIGANGGDKHGRALPSAGASGGTTSTPPSGSGSASPSGSTSITVPPGSLADYRNRPFQAVFAELNGLHLGVNVKFSGNGDDGLVQQTDPPAGTPIHNGLTITLTVGGQPIPVTPPDLTGKSCGSGDGTAGAALYLAGLKVAYADGNRTGVVQSQDKTPTSTDVRWADTVTVTCGTSAPSPSDSASTA